MWRSKSAKKECSNGENYWEGLRQRNYIGGQTSNMTKNIGEEWRKTGDNRRARNPQKEKQ